MSKQKKKRSNVFYLNTRQGENKLSLLRAIIWIFSSTLLISGSATVGVFYYNYQKQLKENDDKYLIEAIVQTGPEAEQLQTIYLAEILGLSMDKPTNLYQFNTQNAKKKLEQNPLIKEAEVKKVSPGMVYIDYTIRKPVAFLGDYSNTALDAEGVLIPFKPFFSPKILPEIYFGRCFQDNNNPQLWGRILDSKEALIGMELLQFLTLFCEKYQFSLKAIDVSKALTDSFGQRQVVVTLVDRYPGKLQPKEYFIRFYYQNYKKNFNDLLAILKESSKSGEGSLVIDLRIPRLAFIKGSALKK